MRQRSGSRRTATPGWLFTWLLGLNVVEHCSLGCLTLAMLSRCVYVCLPLHPVLVTLQARCNLRAATPAPTQTRPSSSFWLTLQRQPTAAARAATLAAAPAASRAARQAASARAHVAAAAVVAAAPAQRRQQGAWVQPPFASCGWQRMMWQRCAG